MKEQLKKLFDTVHLPRWIVLAGDLTLVSFTYIITLFLRFSFSNLAVIPDEVIIQLAAVLPFFLLGAWVFKSYHGIIRHTAVQDAARVLRAHLTGTLGMFLVSLLGESFYRPLSIPFSVVFVHFFFSAFTLIALRFVVQYLYQKVIEDPIEKQNILIFGAGELGLIAKGVVKSDKRMAFNVVGFIDDNTGLQWKSLRGLRVWPVNYAFENIVKQKEIKELIIAIHPENINYDRKREVIDKCIENSIMVREIPEPSVWINGVLKTDMIRKVRIEDLLGRPPIKMNNPRVAEGLKNKRIMVTGGAGSIGSEIVRQLAYFMPASITIVDQGESALYDLQMEINPILKSFDVNYIVADVTDTFRLRKIFEQFKPEIIFHASAYKHVPLMEDNSYEAVRTNVGGTMNVANLASEFKAERFVMVSTDKAVNPTNVMGATKRLCEIYTQSLFMLGQSKTQFITTRFGNVLGSNGSVIPLFRKQIENGGPVTITHKDIIRYFMTIPEACQLVLEAGFTGKGGEIFLFDMGQPVKILDLAKKMIALSGFIPNKDIKIVETGLRPGEKLFEELLASKEETLPTHNQKLLIAQVRPKDYAVAQKKIIDLVNNLKHYNEFELVAYLKDIVPSYVSNNSKFSVLDKPSNDQVISA
jgi:FlaA1/EpsC-like NDP-sugar epimerase